MLVFRLQITVTGCTLFEEPQLRCYRWPQWRDSGSELFVQVINRRHRYFNRLNLLLSTEMWFILSCRRVLLGTGSIKQSGCLAKVCASLRESVRLSAQESFSPFISWISKSNWSQLIITRFTRCCRLALRGSLGQRSRSPSASNGHRNLMNSVASEPLKGFQPKLT